MHLYLVLTPGGDVITVEADHDGLARATAALIHGSDLPPASACVRIARSLDARSLSSHSSGRRPA